MSARDKDYRTWGPDAPDIPDETWYEKEKIAVGFVVSGPLGVAKYPGRRFADLDEAYRWAVGKYARVEPAESGHPFRWAFRVVPRKEEGQ